MKNKNYRTMEEIKKSKENKGKAIERNLKRFIEQRKFA